MEWMYRGYPQGMERMAAQEMPRAQEAQWGQEQPQSLANDWNAWNWKNPGAEPYMVYNRENRQAWPADWDDRRRMQAEYDYVRGLYPMSVRGWQRFVEAEFDRNDGPGSQIYDEYPDREWLYRLRNRIVANAGAQGFIENEDVVLVLVLNEMLRRRVERR